MGRPQLWVLTGANGAGKSTFHRLYLEPRGLPFVNADRIARDLDPADPVGASYEAARHAARLRDRLVADGLSFCYETVFSHPSKLDFLGHAKSRGYEIVLVYVHLESADLNEARVSQRVSEGGHAVPPEKIRSRIPRTIENVREGLALADRAELLDNSSVSEPFRRVATLRGGGVEAHPGGALPGWARAMLAGFA